MKKPTKKYEQTIKSTTVKEPVVRTSTKPFVMVMDKSGALHRVWK